MNPIVFLHIPKTAGQTIHNALARVVGANAISPVRVHSQAGAAAQLAPGYRLYSGHLDWTALEGLPAGRFAFTVLRDPRARIASFYFYLLREAAGLDPVALERPENTGKKMILTRSADDYFFGGDAAWQRFIRDHYDNFYCTYLASRQIRGGAGLRNLPSAELIERACAGAGALQRIYRTTYLAALEADIARLTGTRIALTGTYHNAGENPGRGSRWPELLERLESDARRRALEAFVGQDEALMRRIRFAESPGTDAADQRPTLS